MAKQTLAEVMADARKQMRSSGNDDGPIEKLVAGLMASLESRDNDMRKTMGDLEKRISDSLADQVVEGQKELRHNMVRKGGFSILDNAEVYSNFIDPAGLTMEQKLTMPMSQLQKYLPSETIDRVKILQELNDDVLIIGWIKAVQTARAGSTFSNIEIKDYVKETRTWKALQSVHKALTTGGSATGAEWMPTVFSSQMIDLITVSLKVSSQFSRIDIPANTFKIPLATTDDIAFLVAETTSDNLLDDANVYPRFTPGTDSQSFNAKKIAAIVVFSEEAEEDSIVPLMPFIKMKIANAMANAQERATLDGDITATHMDNDVTAATDVRKAWAGLRFKNLTATATTVDLGTLNLTNVRSLRGMLTASFAENPESLFYITSVKVMLKLLAFPEFLTIDKYGPRATVVTGEVGRIDGSPLLTSKYSRDNVAATGVNTSGGPNTKGLLYLQDRRGYWYGDRRRIQVDSARMIISGQGYVVVSQRVDFKDIYKQGASTNRTGALGINIT